MDDGWVHSDSSIFVDHCGGKKVLIDRILIGRGGTDGRTDDLIKSWSAQTH